MIRFLLVVMLLAPVVAAELAIRPAQVVDQARAALGPLGPDQSLEPTSEPAPARVQAGQLGWQTSVVTGLGDRTPRVRVVLQVDGQVRRTWLVCFRKAQNVSVLVTARALPRGLRLGSADVRKETRAMGSGESWLSDPAELEGLELRRNLPPGQTLKPSDTVRAVLMPAGQSVTVTVRQEGLVVRLAGRTLEPAMARQPFRVRTASGSVLTAVLTSDGEVVCTTR